MNGRFRLTSLTQMGLAVKLAIPFLKHFASRLSMGLGDSLRRACEIFFPVAAPPCHFEVCVVRKAQLDCMEPGMGSPGMEAENIAI